MSNNDDLMACASCIGRRAFLAQGALAAAAMALAACGGADATAPTLPTGSSIKASDYAALSAVGGIALVNIGSAQLAVVRADSSSFVAISRVCTHQGGIVNRSGTGFLCPNHGAMYSATGVWIGGQPTSSLHTYTTSYDAATGVLSIG